MTLKVEQNPKKPMARDDTRRHGKAREDTTRHDKAREGTSTRARGTRAQNISYSKRMAEVSPVAKRFGKFTFFCNFADSEGQKFFSKHVHFIL